MELRLSCANPSKWYNHVPVYQTWDVRQWWLPYNDALGITLANIPTKHVLSHWDWVTHICVSKLTIIGTDNGMSPGRHQAIIWTNAKILLIRPLRTHFSEILIEIHTFSFTKMHLKMLSEKLRPFCLGLNVLKLHALIQTVKGNILCLQVFALNCDWYYLFYGNDRYQLPFDNIPLGHILCIMQ